MNNTGKRPYFLAYQNICWMYINKLKGKINKTNKKFTIKFIVLNEERILHKSVLSKFLSVKRDVNFSTRKSVGCTFLTFGTRYDEFGR